MGPYESASRFLWAVFVVIVITIVVIVVITVGVVLNQGWRSRPAAANSSLNFQRHPVFSTRLAALGSAFHLRINPFLP